MDISVRTEGATEAKGRIETTADALADFTTIWPIVRDVVLVYEQEYLETRGFGSMAALKPSTLKKGKRRTGLPFDTQSHRMWDSFIGAGPDHYYQATATRMEIGVFRGPAHWHMIDRKHMEARPPIRTTPKLRRMVKDAIRGHLDWR